jgi:cytochrome P450
MRHPDKMNQLRRHPELTESAIEELLRYDGPAAALVRIARERIELHGETIEPGDRIFAMLNAANRDPRVFEDPDGIDLGRKENRHLAFGHGIHFCLGAPLARLEGRFAIEAILRRFRSLTLLDSAPPWSDSLVLRGVKSLRVSFAR